MLALHKHSALLEVLLYGIARKMLLLPKDHGMVDIILGVVSIGLLFLDKYSETIFFLISKEYFAMKKPTSQSLDF